MSLGAFFSIACALAWSISIVLFKLSGDRFHPSSLNFFKNLIGLFLLVPSVYFFEGQLWFDISMDAFIVLAISGFIGIGIADVLVLRCLKLLGASRLAIIECLYSPFVIALSITFLNESLSIFKFLGTCMVIASILVITSRPNIDTLPGSTLAAGVVSGTVGMLMMAVGIVAAKPYLFVAPLVFIVALRMTFGVIGSFLTMVAVQPWRASLSDGYTMLANPIVILASVISAYISMIFWVGGYRYTDATIAAVLNQTATVFTVLLAALILKERMTPAKAIGTALAFFGVLFMNMG